MSAADDRADITALIMGYAERIDAGVAQIRAVMAARSSSALTTGSGQSMVGRLPGTQY